MATVINTRDVLLLAASPRLLWTGLRGISVAANTTTFNVTSGVSTPTQISFTATLNGVSGTVTWSVPFGTATLSPSGSTCVLTYANLTTATATIRASVTDGGVTYTSEVTVTKVINGATGSTGSTGAAGSDAKLISIGATSQVFQISKANVASPTSVVFSATRNNLATNPTFSVLTGTATLTSISGDSATLLFSNMSTDTVTIKVTDSTTVYSDTITIVKVREGIDSVTGYLTNEAATLPAANDGTVSSYAGAGGLFVVYYGAADVTASCTFSLVANSYGVTQSIVGSGGSAGTYSMTGGFNPYDLIDIKYRASYTNAFGVTTTIDKTFTVSKSKTGTIGTTGATGSQARIAYVLIPSTSAPLASTPTTIDMTGDVVPTTGSWSSGVNNFQTYTPIPTAGNQVWQTTGLYNPVTGHTIWTLPYLSNLKVGSLSAITINTGTLTVDTAGYIQGGKTAYNTGTGFWLGYDTGAYKLSIGNANTTFRYNGTDVAVLGAGGQVTFGATAANDMIKIEKTSGNSASLYVYDSSTSNFETISIQNSSSSTASDMMVLTATKGNCVHALAAPSDKSAGIFENTYSATRKIQIGHPSYAAYAATGHGKIYAVDGFTAFTGAHYVFLPKGTAIEVGDILEDKELIYKHDVSNILTLTQLATKESKRVLGVFAEIEDPFNSLDIDATLWYTITNSNNLVCVNSLGEGQINVCGMNGNISIGDLITTSSLSGKGCRQSDDLIRSSTVAKSREDVVFTHPSEVKMIACSYLCG